MEMGLSLLSLGELDESEQRLLSLARAQTKDDKGARLALHASSGLAQIFLCKRAFTEADEWCRKSRIGWKRVGGRGHPAHVACLRLSAFSCELQGDHTEAVLFEEMANESKAASVAVDTRLEAYESLRFTIEKSRTLVTEYHKKVPGTTRKEASTKDRRISPAKQPGSDPINGPTAQILTESPIKPKSGTTAVHKKVPGTIKKEASTKSTRLSPAKQAVSDPIDGTPAQTLAESPIVSKLGTTAVHMKAPDTTRKEASIKSRRPSPANQPGNDPINEPPAQILVESPVEPKSGTTAVGSLHHAAAEGDTASIERLLDDGADIEEAAGENLNRPLRLAALHDNTSAVKCLLNRGANTEAVNQNNNTALSAATHRGHKPTVECLLDRGANIEAKDKYDETALLLAAQRGYTSIVECLLDRGANIEAKNQYGRTALIKAAWKGHKSIVECLLNRGANIEAKNNNGNKALLRAAYKGHKPIVDCLLDRGANIEAANSLGETALLRACHWINEELNKWEIVRTIELLCSRGANVLVKSDKGNSPLGYARKVKDSEIREELISVLKKYGAKE